MPNPYESNQTIEDDSHRLSTWRIVASIPFIFFGVVWSLLFIRMPARLNEAWALYSNGGWESIRSDLAFTESLQRCTILPLMGCGALLVAYGLLRRRNSCILAGAIWAVVAFATGDAFFDEPWSILLLANVCSNSSCRARAPNLRSEFKVDNALAFSR